MLKVRIHSDMAGLGNLLMFFYEERDGKRFIAKPVKLEFEEHKRYESINPTIDIPYIMAEGFLNSFAEALDERGIKTDSDAKLHGTLDATRYHLEDMRTLLKLKKGA